MDSDAILTYTSKVDALVDRIDALLDQHTSGQNAITVTHTQESNATFYMGLAVACCAATVALMVAFMIMENRSYADLQGQMQSTRGELKNELRDVKAWSDVLRGKVSKLEAQQSEKVK